MSEGEQMGRLRREITAAYESTRYKPGDSDMLLADAIDRLAADVAAIKEAVCDGSVAEERDRFFAGWAAALNERDKLRAEIEKLKAMLEQIAPEDVRHFVESEKAWVKLVEEQRDAAIRERDEWKEEARLAVVNRDEARAEVERLKAELAARLAGGNRPEIPDSSPAAPQPAAPPAGWLTEEERGALSRAFDLLCDDDGDSPLASTVQSLLARAGSPPVVEVPVMVFGGGSYQMEKRYRAAMDAAGVAWKEVPRE